jgi:hypothetical protein
MDPYNLLSKLKQNGVELARRFIDILVDIREAAGLEEASRPKGKKMISQQKVEIEVTRITTLLQSSRHWSSAHHHDFTTVYQAGKVATPATHALLRTIPASGTPPNRSIPHLQHER